MLWRKHRAGIPTAVALLLAFAVQGCERGGGRSAAVSIRLVDGFSAERLAGSAERVGPPAERTEWRFADTTPSPGQGAAADPSPTLGWKAGPGVAGFAVRDGLLVGRSTTDFPVLHLERTSGLDEPDQLYAIEVRMRTSAGGDLSILTRPDPAVDLAREVVISTRTPWPAITPIVAGDTITTYTLVPRISLVGTRIRHILLRPTDAAGAEFAIESVRLVFRREHLAGLRSGVSWQGLGNIFHETLVLHSPEIARFEVELPERPVFDVALGSPEEEPVTFTLRVERAGEDPSPRLAHSVTTAHRWERRRVDLSEFAGRKVTLTLAVEAERSGTIGFWGAPAVRRAAKPAEDESAPPRLIIMIQGDTLRRDHLELYGYERRTAPALAALAAEGARFDGAITQTAWTKAATPSILTGLYPSTHGVHKFADRLPASATTIAEIFRAAGYATLSFSSVPFTGQFSNLHQGFEELHESESTVGRAGPRGAKTAREYVDRLLDWLDGHRDVPAFVYLHFFDPHSPYEPNAPFDTMWADPAGREEYLRQQERLKSFIADPFLAPRGMATPAELHAAGIDPEIYLRYSRDWYDGSIRGMDREIARLVERLRDAGLAERSLIAFFSDHGEEFHDHGSMWHGQSVYGEMIRVPVILWGPGRVPAGLEVTEPVQLVDLVPTLLDLSGLEIPDAVQGASLRPALLSGGHLGPRPVFAELQPRGGNDFPGAAESYAIVDGG